MGIIAIILLAISICLGNHGITLIVFCLVSAWLVIGDVYIVVEYCIKPKKSLIDGLRDWKHESDNDV